MHYVNCVQVRALSHASAMGKTHGVVKFYYSYKTQNSTEFDNAMLSKTRNVFMTFQRLIQFVRLHSNKVTVTPPAKRRVDLVLDILFHGIRSDIDIFPPLDVFSSKIRDFEKLVSTFVVLGLDFYLLSGLSTSDPSYSVHLGLSVSYLSGWGELIHLSRSTYVVRMTSVRFQVLDDTGPVILCPNCTAFPTISLVWISAKE